MWVSGESFRVIGEKFGIDKNAVGRHCHAHISARVVSANAERNAHHASNLLDELDNVRGRLQDLADKTEKARDWRGAIAAYAMITKTIETVTKITEQVRAGREGCPRCTDLDQLSPEEKEHERRQLTDELYRRAEVEVIEAEIDEHHRYIARLQQWRNYTQELAAWHRQEGPKGPYPQGPGDEWPEWPPRPAPLKQLPPAPPEVVEPDA
jgi:hypothetical protein